MGEAIHMVLLYAGVGEVSRVTVLGQATTGPDRFSLCP